MGRFKGRCCLILFLLFWTLDLGRWALAEERIYVLSLEEAAQLALMNNFDIQVARYDAQIAATNEGVAESVYDTFLSMDVQYQTDQSASTSALAASAVSSRLEHTCVIFARSGTGS